MTRTVLTGPRTFFVYNTSGADANDGLTPTSAWLHLQYAWDTLQSDYDLNGQTVTIQLNGNVHLSGMQATGTIPGLYTPRQLQIIGTANPLSTYIMPSGPGQPCLTAAFGAMFSFSGVTLDTRNSNQDCVIAGQFSQITNLGNVAFNMAGNGMQGYNHVTVGPHALYEVAGSYQIYGSAASHIAAGDFGDVLFDTNGQPGLIGVAVWLNPYFPAGFAAAYNHGCVNCEAVAFSGGARGPRWLAKHHGLIDTLGGGPSYFPGDAPGFTDSATFGVYC